MPAQIIPFRFPRPRPLRRPLPVEAPIDVAEPAATRVLASRIARLGCDTLLEDQDAAIATWQVISAGDRCTADTAKKDAMKVRRFLASLSDWQYAGRTVGPATLWHLLTPGVGQYLLRRWRDELQDPDEVVRAALGEGYETTRRFARSFLCAPGTVVLYEDLARLRPERPPRQRGCLVPAERYGPLVDPFPNAWRPRRRSRRRPPVPAYAEWLGVLDVIWWLVASHGEEALRRWFPFLHTAAMVDLGSAIGARPGELRLVKIGQVTADAVDILHGAVKGHRAREKGSDRYGIRLGSYRRVPLQYVPDALRARIQRWPAVLAATGRLPVEPDRARFPTDFGVRERCVSYPRYRHDLQRLLLRAAQEPAARRVLEPYLRPGPDGTPHRLTITPHTLRAIYATWRLDLCDEPASVRAILDDLGWSTYATLVDYDRPARRDVENVRRQVHSTIGEAARKEHDDDPD